MMNAFLSKFTDTVAKCNIQQHLCHTNAVNPNAIVTYGFIKKVSYEYSKDEHLIQTINMKWCDFLWQFTKNMKKFIIHSSSKRRIKRAGAHLAGINDIPFSLLANAVVKSVGILGNPQITHFSQHI